MNMILTLLGLLALSALTVHLVRAVVRDGYGTGAAPRSHSAELGPWIDRELQR